MKDYDPLADSSPGTVDLRAKDDDSDDNPGTAPDALILDISNVSETGAPDAKGFTACHCGCRAAIASKASFKQGHDQRLVGKLVRAGRANVDVAIDMGGMLVHTDALGAAGHLFPSQAGVDKVVAGLGTTTRAARAHAPKAQPVADEKVLGFVKIGRWTYPAVQFASGNVQRNEKPNGTGKWIAADVNLFVAA